MLDKVMSAAEAKRLTRVHVRKFSTKAGLKRLEQDARKKALPAARKLLTSTIEKRIRANIRDAIKRGDTWCSVSVGAWPDIEAVHTPNGLLYLDQRVLKVVITAQLAAVALRKKGYAVTMHSRRSDSSFKLNIHERIYSDELFLGIDSKRAPKSRA